MGTIGAQTISPDAQASLALRGESQSGLTLELEPLASARADWGRLTAADSTARLWHRERWLELLRRAYNFKLEVALLRSGREALAGCVMARSPNPFVPCQVALPFSDRCDPLGFSQHAVRSLLRLLGAEAGSRFEIRGVTAPPPWRTVDCFLDWRLDLSRPPGQIYQNFAHNFRRNIVKAGRNQISVEVGNSPDHLRRFCRLHESTRRRQGVPAQPARFFRILHELYVADDHLQIWFATARGRDLAAILALRDGITLYYKWSARAADDTTGAMHLLLWSLIETAVVRQETLDLGRTDTRNHGLNRFKHESGAICKTLPYAFFPNAPKEISPEVNSGFRRLAAQLWRWLPLPLCRAISNAGYRYLS